jgi:hypothetical protein
MEGKASFERAMDTQSVAESDLSMRQYEKMMR